MKPITPEFVRPGKSMSAAGRVLALGLLVCLLACLFPGRAQAAPFSLPDSMPRLIVQEGDVQRTSSFFLRPLLSWMADPSAAMDVEQALAAAANGRFQPFQAMPGTEAAVVWLCLPVEIMGANSTLLNLNLGQGLPGRVSVFAPSGASTFTEWKNIRGTGTLTLSVTAQAGQGVVPVFIRMEGAPNPWFTPRLLPVAGTEPGGSEAWNPVLAGLFAAIWLFGLLGGLRTGALWRLWCALIAVLVLVHLVYGQAITPKGYVPLEGLPGLLGLCIGILLLPHVGRSLLDTANRAPGLDKGLKFCCFAMAILTLLPFVPGLAWLTRFTPLWPILAVMLLPFALAGGIKGLPHALRFFIGCLLTVITVLPDAVLLCLGKSPLGSSQSGLWGLAIALVLFSSATPPLRAGATAAKAPASPLLPKAFLEDGDSRRQVTLPLGSAPETYLQDPATPPRPAEAKNVPDSPAASPLPPVEIPLATLPVAPPVAPPAPVPPLPTAVRTEDRLTPSEVETALHLPLVTLLDSLEPFNGGAIPEELRSAAETVRQAGYALSNAASDPSTALADRQGLPDLEAVFTLTDLITRVRNATEPQAKAVGLSLTFHFPSELDQSYTGDLARLDTTLRLLLHSAIQATDSGVIHVNVRQHPDNPAPGHLLFTVRDTGTRIAPEQRSLSALYRAWGLASANKSELSFESSPEQGTTTSFGMHLIPASVEAAGFAHSDPGTLALAKAHSARRQRLMQAIVADDVAQSRQLLIQNLSELPQPPLEARNPTEALYLYRRVPVGLIIMDGDMLEADMLEAIEGIRSHERKLRLPPVPLVVLVNHHLQGRLFVDAGATEMLLKPVSRTVLLSTARRLTSMLETSEDGTRPAAPTKRRQPASAAAPEEQVPAPPLEPELPPALEKDAQIGEPNAPVSELPAAASEATAPVAPQEIATQELPQRVDVAPEQPEKAMPEPASESQPQSVSAPVEVPEQKPTSGHAPEVQASPEAAAPISLIKSGAPQSRVSSPRKNLVPKVSDSGLYDLIDDPDLAGLLGETDANVAPAPAPVTALFSTLAAASSATPPQEEKAPARLPRPQVQAPQKRTDPPKKQPAEPARPIQLTPPAAPKAQPERPQKSEQIAKIVMTPRSGAKKTPAKEAETSQAPAPKAPPAVSAPSVAPTVTPTAAVAPPAAPVTPEPPAPYEALGLIRAYLKKCRRASDAGYLDDLEQTATQIATQAELQGWRIVGGMASYIVRAAAARDPQAVMDLLPDLENSVERVAAQIAQGIPTENPPGKN